MKGLKVETYENLLTKNLVSKTTSGEDVFLVYRPLSGGTPRWQLQDSFGTTLVGSVDKDILIRIATRSNVNLILEETDDRGTNDNPEVED